MIDVTPHEHNFKPFHGYQICTFDELVNGELLVCCEILTMDGEPLTDEQRNDIHEEIYATYVKWDYDMPWSSFTEDEQELMELISQCSFEYRASQRAGGYSVPTPIDANLRYKISKAMIDAGWRKSDEA